MELRAAQLIFGRLGRAITRRYKLIVPLWIIALVLATPLLLRASSVVSLQQGSTSNLGLEAQIAQNLVNTKFGSSSPSGSPLVVVISSENATTTTKVHDYVIALSKAIAGDQSLPDYVSGSSAYSSVSTLLTGVSEPEARLSDGAALLNHLFYGVPSLFLSVWSTQFGANQSMIPQAQAATLRTISSEILNQTHLLASQGSLTIFTRTLSDSFRTQESLPLALRVQVAIQTAGANFTEAVLPASQRPFALLVIRSFSLSNSTASVAIERSATNQITKVTLFPPEPATAAYPLTRNSSASFRDQISESVVNDPSRFNIPPVYSSTISGFVSHDGRVMLATFVFKNVTTSELNEVRKLVQSTALPYGLAGSVQVTGQDALNSDITASILNDTDIILPITIVLLLVATGLFFRAVITPFVSLGTISIALGLAEVVVFLVATYVSQVDVSTPVILLTVLIGVGTDYSIFIIARYREERVRGGSPAQSVENAVTWAGESIATSGATVIISFIFLGFQPITFLKGLGLVVGLGVLIALIASLTLIPSVILLLPKRIFFPMTGERFDRYATRVKERLEKKVGYFSRSGKFAIKHAKVIVILSIVVTIPAVYIWANLAPSYDFLGASPKNLESVSAFNTLTNTFGGGSIFPTHVVVKFASPLWNGTAYRTLIAGNPQDLKGIYLGGAAGTIVDTSDVVNTQFYQVIAYVTAAVAVVLLLVLGSLFLPLFAIVSVVMSIAWTLAATEVVFAGLYNFPILYITPLTLFVLLLGLGMDYNIFILTRIREESSKGKPLNEAITTAIENTGG